MKNKRKVISFILFLALIVSSYTSVFAAASSPLSGAAGSSTADKAALLNSLGLYNGTSTTGFTPDLESQLNRETGIVMLIRLMGMEADAQAMTDEETAAALSKFSDASSLSSWAKKAVAFAIQQDLVSGMPGGTLGPKSSLTGNQYSTLILKSLGYATSNYEMATNELLQLQSLQNKHNEAFELTGSSALTKALLVNMSFDSLQLSPKDDLKSLIEILVSNGVVSRDAAVSGGLVIDPPAPIEPEDTDNTGSSSHHHHHSDTTVPTFTVTAASIHAGGDTITLDFSAEMNSAITISALTYSSYSDGSTPTAIIFANASKSWSNGNKTLTVSLDEAADQAYIPAESFIGVSVEAVDTNGLSSASTPVYTTGPILPENIDPVLTSWTLNTTSGSITLDFSEMVDPSSLTTAGITIKATSSSGTAYTLTSASAISGITLTQSVLILLNGDASEIVGFASDTCCIEIKAVSLMDMAGNGNAAVNYTDANSKVTYYIH